MNKTLGLNPAAGVAVLAVDARQDTYGPVTDARSIVIHDSVTTSIRLASVDVS